MLAIGAILGTEEMVQSIGGNEYIAHLLPPLLVLSSMEETVVRDSATKSVRFLFVSIL